MATYSLKRYLEETQRPIYSAALVLPFLLTYELGVLFLQLNVINGGDALVKRMLGTFFVHTGFASSLVLLVCFIVWQVRTRASWSLDVNNLSWMAVESLFFAVVLYFFMGWLASRLTHALPPWPLLALPEGKPLGFVEHIILFCGAGVYEELVFRVLLLGLLMLVFNKLMHMESAYAAAWAVITGALLFSLFHYVGPYADRFELNSFSQRAFAGVFFAALYVTRSFGIAAASHALYDMLVYVTAHAP